MTRTLSNWMLVVVVVLWTPVAPLTITNLYVPREAVHEAPMDCKYNLEGGTLYDVKWYKDDLEFFRCMANGSVHEFPIKGLTLDYSLRASVGSCQITLTSLTSSSSGQYKCEVSLDAPTFKTVSKTVDFRVSQPSRHIQDFNDIDSHQIKSFTKPEENTHNRGMSTRSRLLQYLVLFIVLLCF